MEHPGAWMRYVPEAERPRRLRQWRRAWLKAQLQRRRVQIALLVVLNVVICLVPWWMGLRSLTVLALLPIVSVPLVGGLAYWITWGEFHR
jgi:hypothetical protein